MAKSPPEKGIIKYFPVAMRVGETPVHISNTMVKPYPAWDTALATVWESRWLPDFYEEKAVKRACVLESLLSNEEAHLTAKNE